MSSPDNPDAGTGAPSAALDELLRRVRRVEDTLVVCVYALMMGLPVLEPIARKMFGRGIAGGPVYVQHLTLWAGFWGAALAAREEKHLSLSIGEFFNTGRRREVARLISHSVAAAVSAMLVYAGILLVQADSARSARFPIGIPEWTSEIAMPLALGFCTLRFVFHAHPRWWGRLGALAFAAAMFGLGIVAGNNPVFVGTCAAILVVALLMGAPVFVAMSGFAMLLFFNEGTPITAVPAEAFRLVESPALPAVPLLTIAGYILAEGGASARIVRLLRAWLGWFPGGSAVVVALVCAVFTTLTGGSGVTILALGGVMLPILVKERYPDGFSLGLVTASGGLGLLFWPSVPVLLYSVVAHVPVADLYVAGFLPGLLMVVMVALYGIWVGRRAKVEEQPFDRKEGLASLWGARWDLGLPVVIGVALFTGYATMVEAAGLAVAYAVLVECGIFKTIHPWKKLPEVVASGGTLVGSVVILLGMALGLTGYLVDAEIPAALIAWTTSHIKSPWVFLLVLNLVLLVLGSVLEIYGAIIILSPLLAPLAGVYGIDPVHLAVVFLANLEMGFLLPPFGLNLFLSASRFSVPLPRLYKTAVPFLVIIGASVLITTYFEPMSTGMLRLLRGTPAADVAPAPDAFPVTDVAPEPADAAEADVAPEVDAGPGAGAPP